MKILNINDAIRAFNKLDLEVDSFEFTEIMVEILNLVLLKGTDEHFETFKNLICNNFYILKECDEFFIPMYNFIFEYKKRYNSKDEKIEGIIQTLKPKIKEISEDTKLLNSINSLLKQNKGNKDCKEFLVDFINDIFKNDEENLNKYLFEIEYSSRFYKSRINYSVQRSTQILLDLYAKSDKKYLAIEKANSLEASIRYQFYKSLTYREKNEYKKLIFRLKDSIAYYELNKKSEM